MTNENSSEWLDLVRETFASYRQMIDATVEQLTDEEIFQRPAPEFNSVAILLRHLGGNLRSRWTDFLTTDGEKPDRDRDREFIDWDGDRESLMEYFGQGWMALEKTLHEINTDILSQTILIRGESHTVRKALLRSLTHLTYHVGQITMTARLVHQGDWNWLTVAPGKSNQFNQQTWGTAASRSILSGDKQRE